MFLQIAKEIWDTFKVVYDNEKNMCRVLSYMSVFSLSIEEDVFPTYFSTLCGIFNEPEVHQPPVTNLKTLEEYR